MCIKAYYEFLFNFFLEETFLQGANDIDVPKDGFVAQGETPNALVLFCFFNSVSWMEICTQVFFF